MIAFTSSSRRASSSASRNESEPTVRPHTGSVPLLPSTMVPVAWTIAIFGAPEGPSTAGIVAR